VQICVYGFDFAHHDVCGETKIPSGQMCFKWCGRTAMLPAITLRLITNHFDNGRRALTVRVQFTARALAICGQVAGR